MLKFKTEPFPHQLEVFERTKDRETFALFWEMGCGKTWVAINTAAHLFLAGKIDGLLVVAPNGVHRNWITDELPIHCPIPYLARSYSTDRAGTRAWKDELRELMEFQGLAVLTIPYQSFITDNAKEAAWKFLQARRCLYVADESHWIKSPKAQRTKSIVASAVYAPFRRILTGTPYLNSPFDLYPQMRFLDPDFWVPHGLPKLATFKAFFSVTRKCRRELPNGKVRVFPKVVAYRNEERLRQILEPHRARLTTEEALPYLPERTYTRVPVELNAEQRALYSAVASKFLDEFREYQRRRAAAGKTLLREKPPDHLTALLRLQQIVCGYYPSDDEERLESIGTDNPRLRAAIDLCDSTSERILIWARFTRDVDLLLEALGTDRAARYDGLVDDDGREESLRRFRAGEVQALILKPRVGGTGLTLNEATRSLYYSNSFDLGDRLQSERRNHRAGQRNAVGYWDLVSLGTIDEKILAALRSKIDVAQVVNGDEVRDWLLT